MNHTQTLVHHTDIQNWVTARHGMPAFARIAGQTCGRLALSFGHPQERPTAAPALDDGISPVSWHTWLAELDRQRLALKVSILNNAEFEFVERDDHNSGAPLN
ncbi:MAG: hypothetical protein P4M09_09045 [Devosia sp.]|nr:hypothetical protein [Devosia sp.]